MNRVLECNCTAEHVKATCGTQAFTSLIFSTLSEFHAKFHISRMENRTFVSEIPMNMKQFLPLDWLSDKMRGSQRYCSVVQKGYLHSCRLQ